MKTTCRQIGATRTARGGMWLAFVLLAAAAMLDGAQVSAQTRPRAASTEQASVGAAAADARARYTIRLKLDFDRRSYNGTERVRWVNRDTRPTSVLYFHLYANFRAGNNGSDAARNSSDERFRASDAGHAQPPVSSPATATGANAQAAPAEADEPSIEVTEVRASSNGQPLAFSLDEQRVTLRVQLREALASGAATEIELTFKGSVPEIDPDETSLSSHVVQQVGAAIRDTREWRRARDSNFFSRGVMLLGTAYPVLAVRDGDDWQRKVEASVGDVVYTEAADYEVSIDAPADVALYTSAGEAHPVGVGGAVADDSTRADDGGARPSVDSQRRSYAGEKLRSFAVIAGRTLRAEERTVSGVVVRSIYMSEHETTGQRVLAVAAEAVRVFVERFGASPFRIVNIAEAPLVAGVGNMEFAGLGVVASAYYVDFDSPATRNLPSIVREQRASVEDSLEFAAAHVLAHQWWGASVGSDPERTPVLDEALSHWSALLYYQEAHGAERAAQALDDQLRGVYQIYRTFGGDDMSADHNARDYRNSFQYAAIVSSKGALMFIALRKLLGEERFWKALRGYYEANRFEIAEMDDLEAAFVAEVPVGERRALTRLFNRWLSEKRGDEDIAPPNPQLAAALGLAVEQNGSKDRNTFSRLGRFFWRQMTRIR